ncbi:MAG: dihydrolipoyl dehydrogenase [Dehalococcoidia bacterium]
MSDSDRKTRLVVLGAGPGGYAAAFLAADLGLEVTLVDAEPNPGGVCLYRGCIPSKALLHVARFLHESKQAAEWGVKVAPPEIDLDALRSWKDGVVRRLTGGLGLIGKQRKVNYVQGLGRFTDAQTLHVRRDGELQQIGFDACIVATGSLPLVPPILRLESPRVMDSTSALQLEEIPDRLLVIGGGYIGLEMGTVYAALGSQVTVVEMMSGLLPGVDRDLVKPLTARLQDDFTEILLNTKVTQMEEVEGGIRVKLSGANVEPAERVYDRVLVSVGRRPNTQGLGLEETGVRLDDRGFVETDPQRRTAEPTVFAIGDIAGEPMLAHKAAHEGRVAVEAVVGKPSAFDPLATPAVVFTDPEIAWCGLTEEQARGRDVEIVKYPWRASGRAMTLGRSEGLTKLILERGTERLLGVGIVGAGAGELIAEGVLAVEMGARASDLHLSIHAHPTLSETIMEAAAVFFGQSPHYVARSRA